MPNAIEALLGASMGSGSHFPAQTGGPSQTPPSDPVARIQISFNIVAESYVDLSEFVDGKMDENATIVVDKSEEESAVRRSLYTYLHHYLSSLYSYNEQVKTFVNEFSGSGEEISNRALSPYETDTAPHSYVSELAYPLGLRHGLQHGDYQFLNFDQVGDYDGGDFTFHELKFRTVAFQNSSVEDPDRYLAFLTNASGNPQLPLCYIHEFNVEFNQFHQDLTDWIDGNP